MFSYLVISKGWLLSAFRVGNFVLVDPDNLLHDYTA